MSSGPRSTASAATGRCTRGIGVGIGVPLIDISGFAQGGISARKRIARDVADAVETIGFLAISGHGVPDALMRETQDRLAAFFDLPESAKAKYVGTANSKNRGYLPFGRDFVSASVGGMAPPDWRETFGFGRFDMPSDDPYFADPEAGYAYQPNILPTEVDGLAETAEEYYRAIEGLNVRLLAIFECALDLEEGYLQRHFDRHASILRAINYPEQDAPPAEGQLRCGAHTDFGSHTLLTVDDAPGGLQVRDLSGTWVDVSPPPGTYVVNIGDLLMTWTNDRWLSNFHRVVNPPRDVSGRTRRQSVAFFVQPNYDAVIECIESCRVPGEPPKHPPVVAWQYRHAKLTRTTAGPGAQ